jgi:transcriptional regulator with GAF, ATPase, and Fis domain
MYNEIGAVTQFEGEIVGQSPAFQNILIQVRIIAKIDSATLIQGETGTGKEVIARAIHNQSSRSQRPFVKLNCAAIPGTLFSGNSSLVTDY